jgi:hypothetical protein
MRRSSEYFITRLNNNKDGNKEFDAIRNAVRAMNKNNMFVCPMRAVKKPREPKERMFCRGRTRPVGYNYNGDVIGGMDNADAFDVYLYRKSV